jgi:hypothetical protein
MFFYSVKPHFLRIRSVRFRYYSAEFFRNGVLMAILARTYFVCKILPFERWQGPFGKGLLGQEGESYTLQLRHFVI